MLPLTDAVGRAFTFTTRVPVRSAAIEVQLASLKVATLYVVVDDGETLTLIVGAVPLNAMAPGFNVPLMVPLPVTLIAMLVDPPLHIVVLPLTDAVGRAFTFTTRVPVRSAAIEVQFASLKVATLYVVVDEGETLTLIVPAVPLNAMAPGFKVPLMVPLPVTLIAMLVDPPLHIVVLPLTDAVGRAFTVTVTVSVSTQFCGDVAVTVYVIVEEGLAVGVAAVVLLKPVAGDQT